MADEKFDPESPENKALLNRFFADHNHIIEGHKDNLKERGIFRPSLDESMLDLHGNMAIAESLMRFKPEAGKNEHTIVPYAKKMVQGRMMDYIKGQGGVDKLIHRHAKTEEHKVSLARQLENQKSKQAQPELEVKPAPIPTTEKKI